MKNVTKRPDTQNEGASLERQAWMAFGRRTKKEIILRKPGLEREAAMAIAERFLEFGKDRTKRNADSEGGLGRKNKAGK